MKGGREGGEMQLSTPTTTKTTRVRHYNPLKKKLSSTFMRTLEKRSANSPQLRIVRVDSTNKQGAVGNRAAQRPFKKFIPQCRVVSKTNPYHRKHRAQSPTETITTN